jgi:MFS family permease
MAKVDNKEFKKYGGYLFPSVTDLTTQIVDFGEKVRPKSFQFTLIAFLTILIGVTASLTRSPQAFMAGPINSSTSTFEFDESKYVSSTSYLIAFGITKAFGNVICGMLCDTIGRRPVHILGWFIAIPIPIMIILAPNWSTVVAADMFLGFNQAFTWMTSIIMMVDLAGPSHRGIAIGMSGTTTSIFMSPFDNSHI